MLQLNDRQLILDALRTPSGYQLDCAVGTTYTLDLVALMQVTLAFATHGDSDEENNPIAKLNVLHRYVDKMTVFCDAGHISVPNAYIPLFAYFEDAIYEVDLETNGAFHPKIWCVRYKPTDENTGDIQYKLLCLSRNITFDRSWDTVLTLSGTVKDTEQNDQQQDQLSDFFQYLFRRIPNDSKGSRKPYIDLIKNEIKRVKFHAPDGFDNYIKFHPILPGKHVMPFPDKADKMVVISPFVTLNRLKQLNQIPIIGKWNLVTRIDSLMEERKTLRGQGAEIYVLSPDAEPDGLASDNSLDGLHAKLYVFDRGENTRLFTGSANATRAAFSDNVEFLIELRGNAKTIGTCQLFPDDDSAKDYSLFGLLDRMPESPPEQNDDQKHIEEQLDNIRRNLLRSNIRVRYTLEANHGDEPTYSAHFESDFVIPTDCKVYIQLASQAANINLDDNKKSLTQIPVINLTTFFVFTIHLFKKHDLSFIHQLPTEGIPDDRASIILTKILDSQDKILRFLMLLLMQDNQLSRIVEYMYQLSLESSSHGTSSLQNSLPLFEVMVQALDKGWSKLDEVNRLITELRSTEAGRNLIPDDLLDIWKPIWAYRQQLDKKNEY
jgi:hypothetical protein